MQRREYSAGAVKHSFWFMEFRKIVQLLSEGMTMEEIKKMNQEENIFGALTVMRATQIFHTVSARVKMLDDSFYPVFVTSEVSTQKLFNLAAVMAYDTLFGEFVYEVVREKMIIGSDEFTDSDICVFFKNKQLQDEKVAACTWRIITTGNAGACIGYQDGSRCSRNNNCKDCAGKFGAEDYESDHQFGFYAIRPDQ